jgi:general secretion pathway protein L
LSTLYIRLPSRAIAESMQNEGAPLYCQFASVSNSGTIERDGVAALSELSEAISRVQRVVLLVAASDVTLLRVKVPPMSASMLKTALPNLVEDQLMSDPAECVVVAGDTMDDLRTVAVVQRGWLELLNKTVVALGARSIAAFPAQLCQPYEDGKVSAAVVEHGADVEVAVRLAEQEGIGLPVYADLPETAPVEVIHALAAVVPQTPINLYVTQPRLAGYQDALRLAPALEERIALLADTWPRWIEGADRASINLMQGLGGGAGPALDWRPWRWPLALAAAALIINIIGLNVEWLKLRREANDLQARMEQTYRSVAPKNAVIIDPLAQIRQKASETRRQSGQIAQDDFVALTSALAEVWAATGQRPQAIAGLEYQDRGLSVRLKPDANVPMDKIKSALAAHNLTLAQSSAGVWQIRSAK